MQSKSVNMCIIAVSPLICEKSKINSICQNIPGDTSRLNDVTLKSMLRYDVAPTSLWHHFDVKCPLGLVFCNLKVCVIRLGLSLCARF